MDIRSTEFSYLSPIKKALMNRHRPCRPMNPHPGISPALTSGYCHAFPNRAGGAPAVVHCWSYTFSAKEKDVETGYSYFGSRYYSSDLSIWLSVDPMAAKYASLSPYVYCADNPIRFVDPNGDTIRVVNKQNQFLFSLDDQSKNNTTLTAWDLYKKGIQWFEPEADNYMPLLSVNRDIEKIEGIAHFSWQDIESFSMTDRFMLSYRNGGVGDFKKDKPFLCTVDGIPYWTDAIGQIPFAINCYKMKLMDGFSSEAAAAYTQKIGHLFANGRLTIDTSPNDYDNMMIQRVCNWAKSGFRIGNTKKCGWYIYHEVNRTDYDFKNMAIWKIK